jgi:galactokinase
MMDLAALRQAVEVPSGKPARIFSAPGRVNLIGEHTDYNRGFVLPIAIDRRTFVAASPRNDRQVRVRSCDLNKGFSFSLDEQQTSHSYRWTRYVEGVARVLDAEPGVRINGADLAIKSDVPIGAGLSSSAALEISVGFAFLNLAEANLELPQLALAAQQAEHVYAGTDCGVMDQMTAAFGQRDCALLIDCRTLQITHINLNISDYEIVICNTNIKHELANSAYNERRAECQRAVQLLSVKLPDVRSLRDVTKTQIDDWKKVLPQPLDRRAHHVVTENERTLRAAEVLKRGNVSEFGELMVQSHRSLRDDFEVSCAELDAMVDIAMSQDGVAGARMTGGGFGGCTVNLVQRDAVDRFRMHIEKTYQRQTGIAATTYIVKADGGVQEHA